MSGKLGARLRAALHRPLEPAVAAFGERIGRESGALAVLFYGSNLRTESLEGVLDFYVLLPGRRERGIWPRVSYREGRYKGAELRAKIATMTLATFHAAAAGATLDTTIWARFVQPSALAWARDERCARWTEEAVAAAVQTAGRLAATLGPDEAPEEEFWKALFRATYRAELRVEKAGREDSIIEANAAHFDGLLPLALDQVGIAYHEGHGRIRPHIPPWERIRAERWWNTRRRLGKPLNIARLVKASTTFDGAARYAAWKVRRHTGIELEVTPWREKHPLLAAPGAAWQIWRARRRERS